MTHKVSKRSGGKMVRCWVTGVPVALGDAHLLDAAHAAALRQELVQRLALLDQLLATLGPRAGGTERAAALGLPAHAYRLICPVLARSYEAALGEGVVVTFRAHRAARCLRWRQHANRVADLSEQTRRLSDGDWRDLYRLAGELTRGLATQPAHVARATCLDVRLALAFRDSESRSPAEWLAGQNVDQLSAALGLSEQDRVPVLPVLASLCARPASAPPSTGT